MLDWRLGTMGFSYAEWAGVFYPRGVKPGDYLGYYAQFFNAVELDTTFHASPPPERVRRWASVVPEDFTFCPKTPRAVTHDAPIDKGVGTMMAFLDVAREFGPKLGCVLLQFPPSFSARELPKLATFLEQMPRDIRFAAEFRHPTWRTPATAELLRSHNVAWVSVDYEGERAEVRATADFLYLRWIGEHDRFPEKDMEQLDMAERLAWWKARIDEKLTGVTRAFGFFNNDYSGYSIPTCERFKRLVGVPVVERSVAATQGDLFD